MSDQRPTLTWLETDAGHVWRSTCGRYAIVAHMLPENPPKPEYQARKIDPAMAKAYPERNTLGYLLKASPWCWNKENSLFSAQAECERDAYCSAQDKQFPSDFPAVAMERFDSGYGKALVVVQENGELIARIMHMALRSYKEGFGTESFQTEINLTELGLVPRDGVQLATITDHDVDRCGNCGVKYGQTHDEVCSFAKCLVTGQQRLLCSYFGGSPVSGVMTMATGGSWERFKNLFKAPKGHDCGQDIYLGSNS